MHNKKVNAVAVVAYHPQFIAVYRQAAEEYTPARDEIQPKGADDIHRTSRGDDTPSLRLG